MQRQLITLTLLPLIAILAGCATSTDQRNNQAARQPDQQPDHGQDHSSHTSDTEFTSTEPLAGESASLTVTGLSCPQCASNLSLNLKDLPGVTDARINLGTGAIALDFGITSPSPKQLADAVADSGFTLISINTN